MEKLYVQQTTFAITSHPKYLTAETLEITVSLMHMRQEMVLLSLLPAQPKAVYSTQVHM